MPKKYKHQKNIFIDGKRYCIYGDTLEEVAAKAALKRRDIEEGRTIITGSMTVKKWVDICLSTYKKKTTDKYRQEMEYRINKYILPAIGHLPVRSVRPIQCQAIINECEGMSYSHLNKLMQEIKFIFRKARENRLIVENPAEFLEMPDYSRGRRRAITAHERKHLYLCAEKYRPFDLFILMLECGCRPAEAMHCLGNDVKIMDGFRMLHIRGTKTKNSDRYVPFPDSLADRFADRITGAHRLEPLSPNNEGRMHNDSSYNRLVSRLRRELNISMGCRMYRNELLPPFPLAEDFVPYDLRHTYCTDLQKAGIDIRVAQKLMGHADITITANIYTHTDAESLTMAAQILGGTPVKNSANFNVGT